MAPTVTAAARSVVRPDYPRGVTTRSGTAARGLGPRLVRPVLVGVAVAACATSAHVLAGGEVPLAAVVLVAGGSALVTRLVGARRLTSAQLLGLLVLGQVAAHLLATPSGSHDTRMLGAHALATLVSLLALRHAEDLWWRAADTVLGLVRVPGLVVPPRRRTRVVLGVLVHDGSDAGSRPSGRAPPLTA
jgi:hypothetical protein